MKPRMKQTDLVKLISKDTGIKYETVRKVLRKLTRYFCIAIQQKESFHIGIGNFHMKQCKPKEVQNFETGERYKAPSSYKLKYTPSVYVSRVIRKTSLKDLSEENTKNDAT